MKPTKQTVCIASDELKKEGYHVPVGFIGKYGYFFTPEELNTYTATIIKQALETAAEKAYALVKDHDLYIREYVGTEYSINIDMSEDSPLQYGCSVITDKESITDTFNETFKKFEV